MGRGPSSFHRMAIILSIQKDDSKIHKNEYDQDSWGKYVDRLRRPGIKFRKTKAKQLLLVNDIQKKPHLFFGSLLNALHFNLSSVLFLCSGKI